MATSNNCGCQSGYVYTTTVYPKNCGCATTGCVSTSTICYAGPNLPNSGITTNECLTTALQKLDNAVNITVLATSILEVISANPTLLEALCELVNSCGTTTTTTSTSSSSTTTTTSTTTSFPGYYTYNFIYNPSTASCSGTPVTMFSDSDLSNLASAYLYTDSGLTIGAPLGYYCFVSGCPNPSGFSIVQVTGPAPGQILTAVGC